MKPELRQHTGVHCGAAAAVAAANADTTAMPTAVHGQHKTHTYLLTIYMHIQMDLLRPNTHDNVKVLLHSGHYACFNST